jgi:flagellin
MTWSVNGNVASIFAINSLNRSQNVANKALQRLSTGLRINSAADDAAGVAVATKLSSQIRSLEQAQRNASDGVSLAQVADGAMGQISDVLIRMRELSVQAGNGSLSATDRISLNTEFGELVNELDSIAANTSYNGTDLLDGDVSTGVTLQVGSGSGAANRVTISIASLLQASIASATLTAQTISTTGGATTAMGVIDDAINTLTAQRGKVGAAVGRLNYSIENLGTQAANLSAARGRVMDADFAKETAALTKAQILSQAGISAISQANYQSQMLAQLF